MADGTVGFQVTHLGQQKVFSVVQIYAMLLGKLRSSAANDLNAKVTDCVVGCPVAFDDKQRHALLAATKIAGLNCLTVFNETSAGAFVD